MSKATAQKRDIAFRSAWLALLEAYDATEDLDRLGKSTEAWRTLDRSHFKGKRFRKPLDSIACLTDASPRRLTLGPVIRYHLLHRLACPTESEEKSIERMKAASEPAYESDSSFLKRMLSPTDDAAYKKGWPPRLQEACAAYVNCAIREPAGLSQLSWIDIFQTDFCGPHAISDFNDFLLGKEPRRQPFARGETHFAMRGEERPALVDSIVADVFDAPAGPLVSNVYSAGMWQGLRAFGQSLAERLKSEALQRDDDRVCLYLPAGRVWISEAQPAGVEASNYHVFLGRLRHFYCKDTRGLDIAAPVGLHENIHHVLHEIRRAMIKRPRILVVNGVYAKRESDAIADIERFIAGDGVLDTLSVLLDPALCAFESPEDIQSFRRNRIIVLSNESLADDMIWSPPHPSVIVRSDELPEPDQDDVVSVFEAQKLKHIEDIQNIREDHSTVTRDWQDEEYHVLSALLVLDKGDAQLRIDDILSRLADHGHEENNEGYLPALMDELVRAIPLNEALERKLLYLIAASPDGLRLSTLPRLVRASLAVPGKHDLICQQDIEAYTLLHKIETDWVAAIRVAVHNLLGHFGTILCLGSQDYFPGLDSSAQLFEFEATLDGGGNDGGRKDEPLSIIFATPALREAAREALVSRGEQGRATFHLCHRIMAEDALLQQTAALRHAQVHETQSIFHWRRQVAAFYHGLCSLPIVSVADEKVRIDDAKEHKQIGAITPSRPRRFWRWLYLFAYRQMIERPPVYAMSRVFGQDQFKLSLLTVFNKPWMAWPHSLRAGQFNNADGLFIGDYLDRKNPAKSARRLEVARAYFFSLFQSNYMLGNPSRMRSNLGKLRNELSGKADISFAMSVLKRRLDLSALTLEALSSVELGVGEITNALETGLSQAGIKLIETEMRAALPAYLGNMLEAEPAAGSLPNSGGAAQQLVELLAPELQQSKGLSSVADVLLRIAEHHAITADQADQSLDLGPALASEAYTALQALGAPSPAQQAAEGRNRGEQVFKLLEPCKPADPSAAIIAFCHAHALFALAEELRLLSFDTGPLSGKFLASGHAMRTMIRVGLKLENFRRRLLLSQDRSVAGMGPFGQRVRRDSDTITRHMHSYPRERATQLITEASMLRLIVRGTGDDRALHAARTLLARAEAITSVTSAQSRHRLRLALERGKLHRSMCEALIRQGEHDKTTLDVGRIELFAELYEWDIDQIRGVSQTRADCKVWEDIEAKQRSKFMALRDKLTALLPDNAKADDLAAV